MRHAFELRAPGGGATLVACGICLLVSIALVSSQGGYFSTSWGWSAMIVLGSAAFAAFAAIETDAGRFDLLFAGALTALAAWTGLSVAWSTNPASSVLELERAGVYAGAVAAFLLLTRRNTLSLVVAALQGGITLVAGYALLTRLFPQHIGSYDGFAGYRLAEPIGYWNGLAIFCVLGILVAFGVFAHRGNVVGRGLAAGSLVVLLPTLYFTFSRGGWGALAVGVLAWFVVTPRRLRTVGYLALLAPLPVAAVALSADSPALTHRFAGAHAAESAGSRLAVWLVLLLIAQIGLGVALSEAASRLPLAERVAPLIGGGVAAVALAAVVVGLVHFGGPVDAARRAYDSFRTTPSPVASNLNKRLFTLSSNGREDVWRAAWDLYVRHEALGAGAGSFERFWLADRRATFQAADAHNLYLETLAELGPVGLGLLVLVALAPAYAVFRHRNSLSAGAFAAFVAYLAHAAVDWDWELSGVTATALLCAATVVVAARRRERLVELPGWPRAAIVGASVACFAGACVGWIGNTALARAETARDEGRYGTAIADADRARKWMPWSARPRLVAGESYLLAGSRPQAYRLLSRALKQDDGDWETWFALSKATDGPTSRRALARAAALNRPDPSIGALERQAAAKAGSS